MSQIPGRQLTSEEEYRNILESISGGLVIYDIGLDSIVDANPAACEMHDYTREEFIGLNPAAFMLPETYDLCKEQIRTVEPGTVLGASASRS